MLFYRFMDIFSYLLNIFFMTFWAYGIIIVLTYIYKIILKAKKTREISVFDLFIDPRTQGSPIFENERKFLHTYIKRPFIYGFFIFLGLNASVAAYMIV